MFVSSIADANVVFFWRVSWLLQMPFRKKAGEHKLILQAYLKDVPFWLSLTVEGDVFESEGNGCSMAICLIPQEFSEKLCHLLVRYEAFTKSCAKSSLSMWQKCWHCLETQSITLQENHVRKAVLPCLKPFPLLPPGHPTTPPPLCLIRV